jgi:hypothetical protein
MKNNTIPNPRIKIEDITSRSIFTMSYILPYNSNMNEPLCIRYFYNESKANSACEFLKNEGFECYVSEDKFEKLTLDKVGMRRRFRLNVERTDVYKIAEVLAKKMKKK